MSIIETINDQTPIALGSVIALFGGAVTVAIWLVRGIAQIRDDLRDVKSDVAMLRQETTSRVDGTVKMISFARWVTELQRLNPEMHLPEDTP